MFCYFGVVLSIGKIALGQHRYYEQQVAQGQDDYYTGRGEAPANGSAPARRPSASRAGSAKGSSGR